MAERLGRGPFCARASLERTAAEHLAGELEALGARTSLASDQASLDLGALGPPRAEGGVPWQLSTIDGSDDERTVVSPARMQEAVARSGAPSLPPPVTGSPAPLPRPTRTTPHDPFLPPEMHRDHPLELAEQQPWIGVSETVAGRPMTGPAPVFIPIHGEGVGGRTVAAVRRGNATMYSEPLAARARRTLAESSRARFASGVALAFTLGLVAAQITDTVRRAAIHEDAVRELDAAYATADTPEEWATLDSARADALALVERRQTRHVVSVLIVWLAVAGAVLFVWLRLIDWGPPDHLAPAGQSPGGLAAAARRRPTR